LCKLQLICRPYRCNIPLRQRHCTEVVKDLAQRLLRQIVEALAQLVHRKRELVSHPIKHDQCIQVPKSLQQLLFLLVIFDVLPNLFVGAGGNINHKAAQKCFQLVYVSLFQGTVRVLVRNVHENVFRHQHILTIKLLPADRSLFLLQLCLAQVLFHLLSTFSQFFRLRSCLNIIFHTIVHHRNQFSLRLDRSQFTLQPCFCLEITELLLDLLVDLGKLFLEPSNCLRHLEGSVDRH